MSQVKIPILDLKPQYEALKSKLMPAVEKVFVSGAYILGPDVVEFEKEVAAYLGVKHAVGVNSGTDALVIGLRAAGIQAGDEVLTTPFSFFATAESISNIGAKPVFVDIEKGTYNLDPLKLERRPHFEDQGGYAGPSLWKTMQHGLYSGVCSKKRLEGHRRLRSVIWSSLSRKTNRNDGRCRGVFIFSIEESRSVWRWRLTRHKR
jgi:hypothetical protein